MTIYRAVYVFWEHRVKTSEIMIKSSTKPTSTIVPIIVVGIWRFFPSFRYHCSAKILFCRTCTERLVFDSGWSVGKRPFSVQRAVKWKSLKVLCAHFTRVYPAQTLKIYTMVVGPSKQKSLVTSYNHIIITSCVTLKINKTKLFLS